MLLSDYRKSYYQKDIDRLICPYLNTQHTLSLNDLKNLNVKPDYIYPCKKNIDKSLSIGMINNNYTTLWYKLNNKLILNSIFGIRNETFEMKGLSINYNGKELNSNLVLKNQVVYLPNIEKFNCPNFYNNLFCINNKEVLENNDFGNNYISYACSHYIDLPNKKLNYGRLVLDADDMQEIDCSKFTFNHQSDLNFRNIKLNNISNNKIKCADITLRNCIVPENSKLYIICKRFIINNVDLKNFIEYISTQKLYIENQYSDKENKIYDISLPIVTGLENIKIYGNIKLTIQNLIIRHRFNYKIDITGERLFTDKSSELFIKNINNTTGHNIYLHILSPITIIYNNQKFSKGKADTLTKVNYYIIITPDNKMYMEDKNVNILF